MGNQNRSKVSIAKQDIANYGMMPLEKQEARYKYFKEANLYESTMNDYNLTNF